MKKSDVLVKVLASNEDSLLERLCKEWNIEPIRTELKKQNGVWSRTLDRNSTIKKLAGIAVKERIQCIVGDTMYFHDFDIDNGIIILWRDEMEVGYCPLWGLIDKGDGYFYTPEIFDDLAEMENKGQL
jgi:hypothetical protein